MSKPFDDQRWVKSGLSWGAVMFVLMTFLFPWWDGDLITLKNIVIGLIIWTIAGLMFGYTLEKGMRKLDHRAKDEME